MGRDSIRFRPVLEKRRDRMENPVPSSKYPTERNYRPVPSGAVRVPCSRDRTWFGGGGGGGGIFLGNRFPFFTQV